MVTKSDDKYTCIFKASFATCYQVVALSILVLKSYFFEVPSFLSNIYNCIKTYILIIVTIARDSSRYKVCSTFKDILVLIWLLFYVVGNLLTWRILFKSWIPGFEMVEQMEILCGICDHTFLVLWF